MAFLWLKQKTFLLRLQNLVFCYILNQLVYQDKKDEEKVTIRLHLGRIEPPSFCLMVAEYT